MGVFTRTGNPDALKLFTLYAATITFRGKVLGGVPKNPELVEVRPGKVASTHPVHGRDIKGAPRVRQPLPVTIDAGSLTDSARLRSHPGPPIDGGPEHIEGQGADELAQSPVRLASQLTVLYDPARRWPG